jgi:hypothetical protein
MLILQARHRRSCAVSAGAQRAGYGNAQDIWAKNGSATPTLMGPAFGKFVTSEIARWADVVQKAGIKPE